MCLSPIGVAFKAEPMTSAKCDDLLLGALQIRVHIAPKSMTGKSTPYKCRSHFILSKDIERKGDSNGLFNYLLWHHFDPFMLNRVFPCQKRKNRFSNMCANLGFSAKLFFWFQSCGVELGAVFRNVGYTKSN